ncbi:hypothetical protein FRB90_009176, partial [Tulasnella sp. 427]
MELLNRMGLSQSTRDQGAVRRAASEAVDAYHYTSISAVRSLPDAVRQSLSGSKSESYTVSQTASIPRAEYQHPPAKPHPTYQNREQPKPSAAPPASSRRRSQSWSRVEEPDRTVVEHGHGASAEVATPTFDPYAQVMQERPQEDAEVSALPAVSATELDPHQPHPWAVSPESTVLVHTGMTTKANVGHGPQKLESLDHFMN